MDQKSAIISGGTGGVGYAIAQTLAHEGYAVMLLYYNTPSTRVDECLQTLSGKNHLAFRCDVSQPQSVADAIAYAKQHGHVIEICVHTAVDPMERVSIADMSLETFKRQCNASLFGGFNLFSQVMPVMKEIGGGLIIGITTSFIEPGGSGGRMAGYIASKYALRGLLREVAREGKPGHIRANAIAPDLMKTSFSSDLPERFFEWSAQRDPRGRITTPDEVAQKVRYLLTEGKGLTGMSLAVATDDITPL